MLWFTCKMLRLLSYCLFLICFNQVICANEGIRWINSDLSSLKDAADSGDAYAQGFLALCHLHGDKGLDVSHLEARFYAESSASKGHWLGNFVVGYLSRYKPIGPDPARVAKFLLKSFRDSDGKLIKHAAIGDPVAAYVLAEIFISDEVQSILNPDMQIAADYYDISAQKGYSPACVQSALIKIHSLADSLIDRKDITREGIALLQNGVEQKLPAAHYYMGRSFLEGNGVSIDKELAFIHFEAAAKREYGPALIILADFYAYGLTGETKQDLALHFINRAIELHEKGAEAKLLEYQDLFGNKADLSKENFSSITTELNPSPKSPEEKSKVVLPNAKIPKASSAKLRIPSAYSKNEKVLIDSISDEPIKDEVSQVSSESIEQIRENAKKIYWARSTNTSMSDAFDAFEKCANSGDAESARYLGIMYMRGKGVSKNADEAIRWFEYAANQGDALAEKNLVSLRKIMKL